MDRYFYAVELDSNGNKLVHLSCNVYKNDVFTSKTNYRCVYWTHLYVPFKQMQELIENDNWYEYIDSRINYLDDITEREAAIICKTYWDGAPGMELHIRNICSETPTGYYWHESEA